MFDVLRELLSAGVDNKVYSGLDMINSIYEYFIKTQLHYYHRQATILAIIPTAQTERYGDNVNYKYFYYCPAYKFNNTYCDYSLAHLTM